MFIRVGLKGTNLNTKKMQKTCTGDSYALSREEEMFSYLSETRVDVIKKPVMITLLPERFFKPPQFDYAHDLAPKALRYVVDERPIQRYYSLLIRLTEVSESFSMVVRNDSTNVLRISLMDMTVHELYLFALGLPADFPSNQILVLGAEREQFVPCDELRKSPTYCYELAVPSDTGLDEYRQRILIDLNKHFMLDVRVEKLTIVKGSRKVLTIAGESVELLWEEQLMLIMKSNQGAKEAFMDKKTCCKHVE